jgi:hypothetical protein
MAVSANGFCGDGKAVCRPGIAAPRPHYDVTVMGGNVGFSGWFSG